VTNTADPFGGSYFVETLTNEIERGAEEYIAKIDAVGGMVAAIERGYPQREIADAAYRYQVEVDARDKIVVGVNDYLTEEKPIEILQIDPSVAARQSERLRRLRSERSNSQVERSLERLRKAAARTPRAAGQANGNLMPYLYEAAKAYATLGEICGALRQVFGAYEEVAIT
jgi:methylmalonyl-CoA mutase N-terminal domain/subunit